MENAIPLHEALSYALDICWLQVQGIDVPAPNLIGAPGAGKTAIVHNLTRKYDFAVLSTHFALKAFEETGGVPQIQEIMIDGKPVPGTIWTFPDIMKPLYELSEKVRLKSKKDGRQRMVIWILDDSHLLGPVHMTQLYETLTERTLRGYKLPDNVAIILAGNDGSSMAGSKTKFSAIVNRVAMMHVYADFDYWKTEFAHRNNIHPAILSFLSQDHYRSHFHEEEQVDTAWASPRSWTRYSNIITALEAKKKKTVSESTLLYLGQSIIGKQAASQFVIYYKIYQKFDVENLLTNWKTFKIPEDAVDQYALSYAVINFYMGGSRERSKWISPIVHILQEYLNSLPDLAIVMCKELIAIENATAAKGVADPILKLLQSSHPKLLRNVLQEVISL